MQENRNASPCQSRCDNQPQNNGMVCIDTKRVLDSCRDRDCFEDVRVYLTSIGEQTLQNATNVRTKGAKLIWAYVGVDEVPFNRGFYQVKVRYYIELELEGCLAVGRSQSFKGLCALEKDVVLYGGEGRAISFTSGLHNNYCAGFEGQTVATNDPLAIVETVEPMILGMKVVDCAHPCKCCMDYTDLPDCIRDCLGDNIVATSQCPRILVSLGVFSVIRMVRPAQLLVAATDYSVPDKECISGSNNDNPCALFRSIAFPVGEFSGTGKDTKPPQPRGGGCGCQNR